MFSALDRLCDSLFVCKCVLDRNECNDCCLHRGRMKYATKDEVSHDKKKGISDVLMGRRNFTLRAYPFIANVGQPGNGQKGKKGVMLNFLIDTGASDNYLDYGTYKLMKFGEMEPPLDRAVVVASGQRIPIVGYKLMHVLLPDGRLSRETRFKIVRGLRDKAVLGDDFLRLHNAILKYGDKTVGLSDLTKTSLATVPSLHHVEPKEESDAEDEQQQEEPRQHADAAHQHEGTPDSQEADGIGDVSETALGRGDTQNSTLAEVSE